MVDTQGSCSSKLELSLIVGIGTLEATAYTLYYAMNTQFVHPSVRYLGVFLLILPSICYLIFHGRSLSVLSNLHRIALQPLIEYAREICKGNLCDIFFVFLSSTKDGIDQITSFECDLIHNCMEMVVASKPSKMYIAAKATLTCIDFDRWFMNFHSVLLVLLMGIIYIAYSVSMASMVFVFVCITGCLYIFCVFALSVCFIVAAVLLSACFVFGCMLLLFLLMLSSIAFIVGWLSLIIIMTVFKAPISSAVTKLYFSVFVGVDITSNDAAFTDSDWYYLMNLSIFFHIFSLSVPQFVLLNVSQASDEYAPLFCLSFSCSAFRLQRRFECQIQNNRGHRAQVHRERQCMARV